MACYRHSFAFTLFDKRKGGLGATCWRGHNKEKHWQEVAGRPIPMGEVRLWGNEGSEESEHEAINRNRQINDKN
jgi:hypothetical protein